MRVEDRAIRTRTSKNFSIHSLRNYLFDKGLIMGQMHTRHDGLGGEATEPMLYDFDSLDAGSISSKIVLGICS